MIKCNDHRPNDKCGVVGVTSTESCSMYIYFALRALQHRGQESAGIVTYDNVIHYKRGMGLVHEIFDEALIKNLRGTCGIGHVRYSTQGSSSLDNAQPVVASSSLADISLGHNGEIVNAAHLREKYQKAGWAFFTDSDSEIIIRMLVNEIKLCNGDVVNALKKLAKNLVGSYSITIQVGSNIYAIRDPMGIKPLCIGKLPTGFIVASESVALDSIGAAFIRDVEPGEIIELTTANLRSDRLVEERGQVAHCMFEFVYFARPDSVLDGRVVYDVRKNIGRIIAKESPVEADYVVPIPDSGMSVALGYSEESDIPFAEGLMKNRYIGRTFIMPVHHMRELNVSLKMNPLKTLVKDKRVILVDDSIVRGTTIRRIVQSVRQAGAKEVHVRIGSPPIISPCYLGIDMKTRDQFVAKPQEDQEKPYERVAKIITADSLAHISIDGLVEAIGLPKDSLCLGCLTEEYPVPIENEKMRSESC
ncbi:MAG: amidophosphoribosyltransferase [Thermoplasmata archaeon]|nr:MAG: amidophosphoribosyltransferase [Thermoplasmata archaeon]